MRLTTAITAFPTTKSFRFRMPLTTSFFRSRRSSPSRAGKTLRRELGLAPGRPVILFASKFLPRKRAGDLLEAYLTLSPDGRQEPAPYLLFVGDGEQRPALEAAGAGDRVVQHPFPRASRTRRNFPAFSTCATCSSCLPTPSRGG